MVEDDYPEKLREDVMMKLCDLQGDVDHPLFDDDTIWDWVDDLIKSIRPYLATREPVSVSLENCGRAFVTEIGILDYDKYGNEFMETNWEKIGPLDKEDVFDKVKIILAAAGLKHVD